MTQLVDESLKQSRVLALVSMVGTLATAYPNNREIPAKVETRILM